MTKNNVAKLVIGEHGIDPGSKPSRTWDKSHGVYIAGRAYLDEADLTAVHMEATWGADRLRLLVGPELREKFDRQRYLLNRAIWHGELEDVRREARRMVKAWLTLDRVAGELGNKPLDPKVWEIPLEDGTVAAIVPDATHATAVNAEGRALKVYTLEEIGRLLVAFPDIAKAKAVFPGATVTAVRRTVEDPLLNVHDTSVGLDDDLQGFA